MEYNSIGLHGIQQSQTAKGNYEFHLLTSVESKSDIVVDCQQVLKIISR